MIDHIWTVICNNVVIDRETNNLSIINVLEQINIPEEAIQQTEILPITVELVSLWVRSDLSKPGKSFSRISLVAPNGEIQKTIEPEINLTKYERLRTRGVFQGFPFKGEGIYRFVVELKCDEKNWLKVASVPLKVIMVHKEKKSEKVSE
jgi:hypothetical protein